MRRCVGYTNWLYKKRQTQGVDAAFEYLDFKIKLKLRSRRLVANDGYVGVKLKNGCREIGGYIAIYHAVNCVCLVLTGYYHKNGFRLHNVFDTHGERLTGNVVNVSEKTGIVLYCILCKVNEMCYGSERGFWLVKANMTV